MDLKNKKHVIESSSGNLGIVLSIICAARKYNFTCVVDKNTLPHTIKVMKAYGAEVVIIETPHPERGYLGARLDYIKQRLVSDNSLVWTNQYESSANREAHARLTARELLNEFPVIDYLFIAVALQAGKNFIRMALRPKPEAAGVPRGCDVFMCLKVRVSSTVVFSDSRGREG